MKELGFKIYSWISRRNGETSYRLCAAGFENLEKLQKEIIPANSKHLKRIEIGLKNKDKVDLKTKHKSLKVSNNI